MSIETVEEAIQVIENCEGPRPMTNDPKVNFLLDVAAGEKSLRPSEWPDEGDWEDVKDEYIREVEAYDSGEVDMDPFDPQEVEERYL